MKSKLLALVLATSFVLTACGGESTPKAEEPKEETKVEDKAPEENKKESKEKETTSKETDTTSKETEEEIEVAENDDNFYNPDNIGKTLNVDNFGEVEIVKAGRGIENQYKVGDLDFSIYGAALVHVKPNTKELKEYWGEETDLILIAYDVVNNSDQQLNLYPTQRKIVTNTQEQLEPDIFVSEGDGELLGNVKSKGGIVYYPESNLDDINEITYYLEKAYDKDFNTVGEDHQIKITFDENGKLKSIE